MADKISVNGREYSPLDFLLGDADKCAYEAKDLPAKTAITVSHAKKIHAHNTSASTSRTALSSGTASRQLGRSKRKVMYTLSGPMVGVAATLAVVAIAGGPITWVLVGGAAAAAAAGVAASYALKKLLRNTRAYYYSKMYLRPNDPDRPFDTSLDALNGVRYILKKRSVSAISDDVKELWKAIKEYNDRKAQPITSCRGALELVYWYDRVWYLHERLVDEMDLFIKFYYYLNQRLKQTFVTDSSALNKANAGEAIKKIQAWVGRDYILHKHPCGRGTIHNTCYAHGLDGKSKKPKISTSYTLTTEQRKQDNRLWMDAIHMSKAGENAISAYNAVELLKEKQKLFAEITDRPDTPLIDETRLHHTALGSQLPSLARTAAPVDYVRRIVVEPGPGVTPIGNGATGGAPGTGSVALGREDDYTESEGRLTGGAIGGGVSIGLGTAGAVAAQLQTIVPVATQSLGAAAASSAGSGGLSAVVMVPLQIVTEIKNIQIELQSLDQQLKLPIGQMDIEKMMTALRTLLKDANFFEKCVNEIIKILRYHEEFKAANEATSDMTCERAFELAYRIVKTVKHFKQLQQYMPFFELFAQVALNVNGQVDSIHTTTPYDHLTADITTWFNTPANHANCKNGGVCYHGTEEAE